MAPRRGRAEAGGSPPLGARRRPRLRTILRAGGAVALAVPLTLAAVLLFRGPPQATGPAGRPDLSGITLASLERDGRLDLGGLGRPAVLNFFASWCPVCVAEMPGFERVHRATGDRVGFVGIALEDDRGAALSLARETGVTYPLVEDPEGRAFRRLGATGMPTTLFVDAGGRVVERYTGPLTQDALRSRLRKHFGV